MPIRPIDIRRKEFKSGFRGYDANQVDDFLDAVADEFERNYTENQRMREEVSSLRDRLQQFEDLEGSIRAALVHAEQASNDLRRAATRRPRACARAPSGRRTSPSGRRRARSHQMLADSSARIERVQDSYEALQEAKRSFAERLPPPPEDLHGHDGQHGGLLGQGDRGFPARAPRHRVHRRGPRSRSTGPRKRRLTSRRAYGPGRTGRCRARERKIVSGRSVASAEDGCVRTQPVERGEPPASLRRRRSRLRRSPS